MAAISGDNLKILAEGAAAFGLSLENSQLLAFASFLIELKTWGNQMNLIHRASDREIIIKDFIDSLSVSKHLYPGAHIADLGSGAGFPGIPLKIARPDLKVVLLEANHKKIYFLRNSIRILGLKGIEAYWTGEEKKVPNMFFVFDFVIARAFASLGLFSAKGIQFLKEGGILLAMKGKRGEKELEEDLPLLEKRGLTLAFIDRFSLPFLGHDRILIGLIKK